MGIRERGQDMFPGTVTFFKKRSSGRWSDLLKSVIKLG